MLDNLSDDLLVRMLRLLPTESVLLCQAVSKRFNQLAGDRRVWKGVY